MKTKIGILLGMSLMVGACGNALNPPKLTMNTSTPSTLGAGASTCSTAQSIKPVQYADWGSFESGIFSGCMTPTTSGTSTTVSLSSPYTSGTQWCFVPAVSNGVSRMYVPVTGGINPIMVCGSVSAHAATVSVPANVQFNSGYVIDSRDQIQMANCLAQQNRLLCPRNYSFGTL